jgi:serpin B
MFSRFCRCLLMVTLPCLGLIAGAQGPAIPKTDVPPPTIVAANNAFGFHLYTELAKTEAGKNIFISPVSLEYCLAMVANGARGNTYAQMAQTLGWGAMPLDQVNAGFQSLTTRLLTADPQVQLTLADSLWLDNRSAFLAPFKNTNTQYFNAELRAVDFTDPATVPTINDWVKTKTQGMIPTLLTKNDVDDQTLLVLLNALYFKGMWTTPFDAKLTTDQPFTLTDGTKQSVKMMQRSDKFSYYEDTTLQMVRLPYGDGRMSMIVMLPAAGATLAATAQSVFTETNWPIVIGKCRVRQGTLNLPRFSSHYFADLPAALQALGITDAFTKQANFSGISNTPSYISKVKHKTALEVNEEGTKAAAVTGVLMQKTLAFRRPDPPFVMNVNHPFLLAIQNEDGALLFLGQITKPEKM